MIEAGFEPPFVARAANGRCQPILDVRPDLAQHDGGIQDGRVPDIRCENPKTPAELVKADIDLKISRGLNWMVRCRFWSMNQL